MLQPRSPFRAGPRAASRPRAGVPAGAELLIYDEIVTPAVAELWGLGVSALDVAAFLKTVGGQALHVRLNSPGGDVFEGVAIYNQLRQHAQRTGMQIVMHVDGLAASIASLVAMAGDEIRVGAGAFFMIHNASTITWGDAAAHRATATQLETITRGAMAETYADRTGETLDQVEAWMNAETWFSPADAVKYGFADTIEEDVPEDAAATARAFDLRVFQHAPAALREAAPAEPRARTAERALREAGFSRQAAKAGALAADRAVVGQREAGDEVLADVVAEARRLTTTMRSAING